jgi:hypothetical protein
MIELNYSRVLTRCMIISALALVAGILLPKVDHLVPFAAALAPLVWYHLFFLRPHAERGLSQAAIDSVYYYGFLITVGALGATALNISIHGVGDDFSAVAFQFGLGLLATGYAVWARVHLVGIAKQMDEDELRDLMGLQIEKSRELLSSIDLAVSSFTSFSETLLSRTVDFHSRIEEQTKSSIDRASSDFTKGISTITAQAELALQDLRGIVNDVTFGAERDELKKSVTSMVQTVTKLTASLDQLSGSANSSATSAQAFAAGLSAVNDGATGTANQLQRLSTDEGLVAKFGSALVVGTSSLSEFTSISSSSAAALGQIGDAASPVSGELKGLATALGRSTEASQAATNILATLQTLGGHAGGLTKDLSDLKTGIQSLQSTIDNLNAGLIDSTGRLKDAMADTSDVLEDFHGQVAAA